jgi:hypothetical protein
MKTALAPKLKRQSPPRSPGPTLAEIDETLRHALAPAQAKAISKRMRQLRRFRKCPLRNWDDRDPFSAHLITDESALRRVAAECGYTPAQLVQIRDVAFCEWLNGETHYKYICCGGPLQVLMDRLEQGHYDYLFN